jgi:hypothetical protein
MGREPRRARALYRRLLGLYPRTFRERFGEAMEQTFADLCAERAGGAAWGWIGFVLRTYADTAMGIARERLTTQTGATMKAITTHLGTAALVGLVLTLPFAVLELISTPVTAASLPGLAVLFALLWLLPTAFVAIVAPVVRGARAGHGVLANPTGVLLRLPILVLIAVAWASILVDQMPCFLGVPNCD